ncbi:hypothetical protein CO151_12335 [bacterium CG_4_9_14_3_um_filter_65_15]|nr:MAG: hypothetical protein CO151_12335 [bacterium CG_4_9_14_3_um_filter_65_15]
MRHGWDLDNAGSGEGRRGGYRAAVLWLLVAVVTLMAGVAPAMAETREHDRSSQDGPTYQVEFSRLAQAWRSADRKTLAGMVHPDGLVITPQGASDRTATYSPSQAFYYFRNLFQDNHTLTFTMTRIQGFPRGDRVHGLALWDFEDGTQRKALRLVIVLARDQDHWYLSEITTIK